MSATVAPQDTPKAAVFICYSRADGDFRERLAGALEARGYSPIYDQSARLQDDPDLRLTAQDEWWKSLKAMIAASDVMVFVVTPESAASPVCDDEIAHARLLGKRVIAVLRRAVDFNVAPERLRALNVQINFQSDDAHAFDAALVSLCAELDLDIEWHRIGARLMRQADLWEKAGRPEAQLLRAGAIADADAWAARRPKHAEEPGDLLIEFLEGGRRKELRDKRQLQRITGLAYARSVADWAAKGLHHEASIMMAIGALAADDLDFTVSPELWEAGATSIIRNPVRISVSGVEGNTHTQGARAALSANSKWLATSDVDGSVKLWNAETATEICSLDAQLGQVLFLRFLESKSLLLAAGQSGATAIWRIPDGELIFALGEPRTISGSDYPFLSEHVHGPRRLSKLLRELKDRPEMSKYPEIVVSACSQDERLLLTAALDGKVAVFDLQSGHSVYAAEMEDPLLSGDISPDGIRFLLSDANGLVRLYDLSSGREISRVNADYKFVWQAAFSPDGSLVVIVANSNSYQNPFAPEDLEEGVIEIREAQSLALIYKVAKYSGFITSVAFSTDGNRLAFGRDDGTVCIADLVRKGHPQELAGQRLGRVVSVQFSPNGEAILAADQRDVAIWSARSLEQITRLATNISDQNSACFSGDGRLIVVAGGGNRHLTRLLDWAPNAIEREFTGALTELTQLALSPDETQFLTTGGDSNLRLWDLTSGAQVRLFECADKNHAFGRFSSDGSRIVAISDDHDERLIPLGTKASLQVWSRSSGEQIASFVADGFSRNIIIDHEGDFAVCGSRLVNLGTGEQGAFLDGRDFEFSPRGDVIVGLQADRQDLTSVRLWDANGRMIAERHVPGAHSPRFHGGEIKVSAKVGDADWRELTFDMNLNLLCDVIEKPGRLLWSFEREDAGIPEEEAWALAQLREDQRLRHRQLSDRVVHSRDNSVALSLGYQGELAELFEPSSGQLLARLEHPARITGAAFVGGTRHLLTAATDGVVRLWNIGRIVEPPFQPKLRLACGLRRGLDCIPGTLLDDALVMRVDEAISVSDQLTAVEASMVDAGSLVLRRPHPTNCYHQEHRPPAKQQRRLYSNTLEAERRAIVDHYVKHEGSFLREKYRAVLDALTSQAMEHALLRQERELARIAWDSSALRRRGYTADIQRTVSWKAHDEMEAAAALLLDLETAICPSTTDDAKLATTIALFGTPDPIAVVRAGTHPQFDLDAVGRVVEKYLSLPYRSKEFDRILLRVHITAALFAYAERLTFKRYIGAGVTVLEHYRRHPREAFIGALWGSAILAALIYFGASAVIDRGWIPSVHWFPWLGPAIGGVCILGAAIALMRDAPNHERKLANERALLEAMARAYRALPFEGAFSPVALNKELDACARQGAEWPPSMPPLLNDLLNRNTDNKAYNQE
jgi:WD40 repeat protein